MRSGLKFGMEKRNGKVTENKNEKRRRNWIFGNFCDQTRNLNLKIIKKKKKKKLIKKKKNFFFFYFIIKLIFFYKINDYFFKKCNIRFY